MLALKSVFPTADAAFYQGVSRSMRPDKFFPTVGKWFGIALAMLALVSPAYPEWKEKVLYSFQGGPNDGATPAGGVVFDSSGNLYGATTQGGGGCPIDQCGTVFELTPPQAKNGSWTETLLHIFKGNTSGDGNTPVPYLASNPGLMLAPKDMSPEMLRPLARNDYTWNPESSSSGPITMVVSAADRALYVYRNGNPIGRASIEIDGRGSLGDHVYSLLEGSTDRQSSLAPGRSARRWMSVTSKGRSVPAEKIAARLRVNPEFGQKVYDTLQPGTTVIITDQPVVRNRGKAAILEG